jgi:hypothetical protein
MTSIYIYIYIYISRHKVHISGKKRFLMHLIMIMNPYVSSQASMGKKSLG